LPVTHEYTLLVGGTVIAGGSAPDAEAIAWAADTILALGSEAEVRAISRGDSHVLDLEGAFVVGLEAPLEVGGPADLAVHDRDPRRSPADPARAVVRGGRLVEGLLPGLAADHDHGH
jgi:predicted amidohydrolase YtcJ